jgi:phosphoribosylglycinamide formyltransferase-1
MVRIVIFASGSGTNAENIIQYFKNSENVKITAVLSNKKGAKVLDKAKKLNVLTKVFTRKDFYETQEIVSFVKNNADFVVLAGFLWKIPQDLIAAFPNKIINIHPALLPKYGGKGMYGMYVHQAVVENKEEKTGITIHFVNENYDEGAIIFQKEVVLLSTDTPEIVAQKIHILEQENFPKVIEDLLLKNG